MANWSNPTLTSTYTNFVTEVKDRDTDLAVGFDPAVVTPTNLPTNAIRWSSAASKWQKWNGSAWSDLSASFAISVTGNAGTATTLQTARAINGVSFNGSADISINTNNSLTFNNGGSGAASGITFNGGSAITISYNSVGAPSTSGANATGTWSISVSGNAATATTLATARAINGVSFNGSADISINTNNSLTFNNGGTGAASGSTFNGGSAATISHNTIGAVALAGSTMTGKLITLQSAAAGAGLNLPHGAAPTAPANGDIWTTASEIQARINGTSKTIAFTDSTITGNAANVTGTVAVGNGGTGATTAALAKINLEVVTSATGSARLPSGTTAQRDGTPAAGFFRFNSTLTRFEGYNGSSWGSVGGATGGGSDDVFYENGQTVSTNYTISTNKNAMSAGPITISSGITVTVPSGSVWVVV